MKVFVVGANGQIGKLLTERLHESENHKVLAMVRKEEQQKELQSKGIETVVADLEGTVEELQGILTGCDAIVFTAGSGGSTGSDKTLLIDLDGAVKTMEAAERAGVDRFIMVSALQANNRKNWNENLKPYYVAKHYADKMLVQSNLNYTIIRPGGLLNEQGIGKITAGNEVPRATIPREDVAITVIEALEKPNTYHRSFDIVSGEDTISDALNNL
ncbi:SDR family oxidoreductase [Metabacillus endolithicus]|uniref:SDR family oxidoreductase n=1 Tax=Metabacillus endolithicus TaxID=1535204 RepID=A0ABW5BX22_9BACI|nr:SDR family oxidoreductase [Metabacillus endolithicus]UPG64082.1 SDR family oxidoreductase [Metabacillus endolithicus]